MQSARCEVKCSRVEKQETVLSRSYGSKFRKPDVVADSEGDFSVRGDVNECEFVTRGEDVGFSEGYFSRDVDVEEVDFAVGG